MKVSQVNQPRDAMKQWELKQGHAFVKLGTFVMFVLVSQRGRNRNVQPFPEGAHGPKL